MLRLGLWFRRLSWTSAALAFGLVAPFDIPCCMHYSVYFLESLQRRAARNMAAYASCLGRGSRFTAVNSLIIGANRLVAPGELDQKGWRCCERT